MRTKEQVLSETPDKTFSVFPNQDTLDRTYVAMDGYAKEVAIEFVRWVNRKCTESKSLNNAWFIDGDESAVLYNSEQLFDLFKAEKGL